MHFGVREFIRWLDANRHSSRVQLNAPATDPEIAALEHRLGVPLPADLRALFKYFNGGIAPIGVLLSVEDDADGIEAELGRYAAKRQLPATDPELLLPFFRTTEGSVLAFDRAAGPLSDTWPIVDYFEDTGEERLVHRTMDGWCRKCVADWNAPDFNSDFTLDTYLQAGLRHAKIEPDVASAHATVAHALRRCGRPEEALDRYLTAARCNPPLEWCDWEALQLAYLLHDHGSAFESAARLSRRGPPQRWRARETSPGRVAEIVARIAKKFEEADPWLYTLDRLLAQAGDDEAALLTDLRRISADSESVLPPPRPHREEGLVPERSDIDDWWDDVNAAYRQGSLRLSDLIFDESMERLATRRPFVSLLRVRRDFD